MSAENAYTDSTQPELDGARAASTARTCSAAPWCWHWPSWRTSRSIVRNVLGDWELVEHRPGVDGLSLHDLPRGRARALRERQRGGDGLHGNQRPDLVPGSSPASSATGRTRPSGSTRRPSRSTTTSSGPTGTPAATSATAPASSGWTPRSTRTSGWASGVALQFRVEMFNVFNRMNFLSDDGNVSTTGTPERPVRHRESHDGDENRECHASRRLRPAQPRCRSAAGATRTPTELLIT